MDRRIFLVSGVAFVLVGCGRAIAPRPPIAAWRGKGQPAEDDPNQGIDDKDDSVVDVGTDDDKLPGDQPGSDTDSRPLPTLTGLSVALTVGHGQGSGSFERGAQPAGHSEYDLNLAQSETISRMLTARGAKVKVYNYYQGHPPITLYDRGQNSAGYDIHVSLHHNSFGDTSVQGGETLVYSGNATNEDKFLAKAINDGVVSAIGVADRGVKTQDLGVLRGTPSGVVKCLCEPFFLSQAGLSRSKAQQMSQDAAQAIAKGIESYWLTKNSVALYSQRVLPEVTENDLEGLYDDHI
ncbi:MAG: N-acetylmuramoyl-L-alanine amidase [Pseudobacteriovorax sp.]|nr:N-acetylmuramoyl-L-alanine amidase [Pseudobacteriovorax sp.]